MSTALRVGLYARCSTVGDRQDPGSQIIAMRQYATTRGWDVVGEYGDRASATNLPGRTAWKQILGLAGRRRLDVILVARLDRAFRSMVYLRQRSRISGPLGPP